MHHGFRSGSASGKSRSMTLAVLAVLATLVFTGCTKWDFGFGYNQGYAPEQPIAYDHSLHAGQLKIQCQYCHNQTERSPHANIPALSTCMNCHLTVKTDSPQIQKLRDAYDHDQPIQWTKVHMLPDFVKFNHSAHISRGVNCQTCHGPIETMKRVSQFSTLGMGWCVNCHRQPENKAPTSCSTCHN